MSRTPRVPAVWWPIAGPLLVIACSLTVPDEDEFFGEGSSVGGSAGQDSGGSGGSPPVGGTAGLGGTAGGGRGGSVIGGAPGEAGAGGGDAGQGGSMVTPVGGAPSDGGVPGAVGGTGGDAGGGLGGEGGGGVVDFEPELGLVAYYPFDSTEGAVAVDVIEGRDGIINGTTHTWVEGQVGGALRLPGESASFVDLPPGILRPLSEMTLSIWFNQNTAALWQRVIDFGSSEHHFFYYAPNAFESLVGEVGARAAVNVRMSLPVELHMPDYIPPPMQWNHLVITWTKDDFYVYLNAEEAGHDDNPVVTPGEHEVRMPEGDTWRNWLGKSSFPDPNFAGMFDELRFYDRALSAGEVRALHEMER